MLNNLYKQTPLQTSFGVNMLALVDGVPRTLNLAQALLALRRPPDRGRHPPLEFRLDKARDRAHIVEGLLKAIDMLDAVIATIRASDDRPAARDGADGGAVRVHRGAGHPHPRHDAGPAHPARPRRARGGDGQAARRRSPSSRPILADDGKLRGVIETEMTAIRDKYANERRSVITHDPGEMGVEDLIDDEEIVVTMTRAGYIKSVAAAAFRTQGRGGRGVQGARLKEEDLVEPGGPHLGPRLPAALLQPGQGLPAARPRDPDEGAHGAGDGGRQPAPAGARTSRSRPSSPPASSRPTSTSSSPPTQGQVKKTAFSEYDKSRREGFIAINLRDGDELVRVVATSGDDDLFDGDAQRA